MPAVSAEHRPPHLEVGSAAAVHFIPTCSACGIQPACWPDDQCQRCQDAAIQRLARTEGRGHTPREPYHPVDGGRKPEPISVDRITAAVARVVRHYALACDRFAHVFGVETAAAKALGARMAALRHAIDAGECVRHAEQLHSLATWLEAVCMTIELESDDAAGLAVDLATIIGECELICRGDAAQDPRCSPAASRGPCVQERESPVKRGGDGAGVADVAEREREAADAMPAA